MYDDRAEADRGWERDLALNTLFVGSLILAVSLAALGLGI